jgi:hypothetical protein
MNYTLSSWFMNQTNRTILSSSPTHLFNELNFQLKFDSFDSWTKSNESFIESSIELFSSWFGSLPALVPTKLWTFKFNPYKILMTILILHNIVVCKNDPYFKNFLQQWIHLILQISPYKMKIGTKSI